GQRPPLQLPPRQSREHPFGLDMLPRLLIFGMILSTAIASASASAQTVKLLWPNGAPGAIGDTDLDRPSLEIFLPEPSKAVGTGVVVCPGGGYENLSMVKEGSQVAEWLNQFGVAAFVVKYRLGPRYHYPAEFDDGIRAMRYVRYHAKEYGVSTDRIGIWGFSAGGHLASSVGTHFDAGNPTASAASDPVDRVSSRPDFMILAYPVITLTGPYVHEGSMQNFLGPNPAPGLAERFSNQLQVTPETPPTFLFCTDADTTVPAENSIMFFMALRKNHVPAELHVFERGPHGTGLAQTYPELSIWPTLLENWLRLRGLVK
ncbi:MAG: alpha/beta hydrolase, partial [Terriglobia bacterium]